MIKFMLDTNIIAYAKNNRPETVFAKFQEYSPDEMCISSITLAELEYGAEKSSNPQRNRIALMAFLSGIQVLPFDSLAAREYGIIRMDLQRKGTPIGANDLLIAAHAKSLGLTIITHNTKEFSRVEDLLFEDWV